MSGKEKEDVVNSPFHYTRNGMETIDVIEDSMSREQYCGYMRGNIIKYLLRYEHKNGIEDLKKANWYLNRLVKTLETPPTNK
jgi:hypothetical protein